MPVSSRALDKAELELDLRCYQLRRGGRKLRLERQPMELLILLAQNRGELVTREQIVAKLWDEDTFLDTERSINGAIRKIRIVLHEDADNPRFIETVVGKGYRFIGNITIHAHSAGVDALAASGPTSMSGNGLSPENASSHSAIQSSIPAGRAAIDNRHYRVAIVLGISLVALVLIVWAVAAKRAAKPSSTSALQIHSLAVLPFDNLSGDSAQDYLADGMTDELITDLANYPSFRVISRTSAMAYRGVRKPLKEVARELGVEAVVEGSITRSGNRVRVRAQLIDARTDQHRWARSYERDITDVVDMESEMAAQVAEQVSLQLSPSKRSASEGIHPRTADAYEYYLKGWYFFDKRTPQAAGESVAYFRKSIEQDPLFAQAHAGLAEALELLSNMDVAAYRQTEPESLAEVRRALELNPKLGEAHSALGLIEAQWNWNWREAERQMKAGLELSPGSAVVHERYAMYLQAMGQVDQAVLEARRALELDPLSFFMNRELGRSLYLARRYDEAVKQLKISAELYPNNTAVNNWLRWIAEKQGNYPLAMQMGVLSAAESSTPANLVRVLREAADSRDWTRYCETERRMHEIGRSSSSSFFIAEDELRLGHKDAAFKWLERSLKEKTVWIMWIKVDPLLDDMRSDPRFRALLEKMGLD